MLWTKMDSFQCKKNIMRCYEWNAMLLTSDTHNKMPTAFLRYQSGNNDLP